MNEFIKQISNDSEFAFTKYFMVRYRQTTNRRQRTRACPNYRLAYAKPKSDRFILQSSVKRNQVDRQNVEDLDATELATSTHIEPAINDPRGDITEDYATVYLKDFVIGQFWLVGSVYSVTYKLFSHNNLLFHYYTLPFLYNLLTQIIICLA